MELFFIISSIWLEQYYYVFGFALLVFIILIVSCAEISIVLTYFQLCGEDYNWWWRSALNSGSSALYLFAYSAYYFFTKVSAANERKRQDGFSLQQMVFVDVAVPVIV